MADITSVGGDVIATSTHPATVASSSRASSLTTTSRPVSSTDNRKGSGSTALPDSVPLSLFTNSTSIKFTKGVDHSSTVQATGINSGAFPATNTISIQSALNTNTVGDTDTGSSETVGPGIVTAVVIGTILVILLPIIILCFCRGRIADRAHRTRWWKRRRPATPGYDVNPFSSETGHSTPTPTPQWATGSHVYRPGDPPIPLEDDEIYSHTLKSKLAVELEHTRMTCLSAASTASHDSTQRPSPAHDAGSQPSLPLSTRTAGSSDPMLSSSLSPSASNRSRTISLRPICLSDYPPIPPLPKSPPPPPPFPCVRRPDSYIFVIADQSIEPLESSL